MPGTYLCQIAPAPPGGFPASKSISFHTLRNAPCRLATPEPTRCHTRGNVRLGGSAASGDGLSASVYFSSRSHQWVCFSRSKPCYGFKEIDHSGHLLDAAQNVVSPHRNKLLSIEVRRHDELNAFAVLT